VREDLARFLIARLLDQRLCRSVSRREPETLLEYRHNSLRELQVLSFARSDTEVKAGGLGRSSGQTRRVCGARRRNDRLSEVGMQTRYGHMQHLHSVRESEHAWDEQRFEDVSGKRAYEVVRDVTVGHASSTHRRYASTATGSALLREQL
jgi:hypothetical protein